MKTTKRNHEPEKQRRDHGVVIFKIPYPKNAAGRRQWAKRFGLNALYAGKHWGARKSDAEEWHAAVRLQLRKQRIEPGLFRGAVRVTYVWNDRLDVDNHAYMGKMILDALKGYLIEDDSRRFVAEVRHCFGDTDDIVVRVEQMESEEKHEEKI